MLRRTLLIAVFLLPAAVLAGTGLAEDARGEDERQVRRVLLLGQGPDGHPFATHEYMAGVNLLARLLQRAEGVQPIVVRADGEWEQGPELIDGADGVVLYLSEGARWLQEDPQRLAAFQRLAERGGGLAAIHWGMGTKDARNIDAFRDLFGGVHGGPDRKYKVDRFTVQIADLTHPIARGLGPFTVREEFYYKIKFVRPLDQITPLVRVPIEEESETVAWAWERPDGGRSFGFTGGHFHENWERPEYRRLVAQGIVWTLGVDVHEKGLNVEVTQDTLELEPRPR